MFAASSFSFNFRMEIESFFVEGRENNNNNVITEIILIKLLHIFYELTLDDTHLLLIIY